MAIESAKYRSIAVNPDFHPTPEMIDTSGHLWSAFGECMAEVSARWIVRFLQAKKLGWVPVNYVELNQFYNSTRKASLEASGKPFRAEEFYFNALDRQFLVKDGENYLVTHEFVTRCYASAPADEL
jgi:hypothetical protein